MQKGWFWNTQLDTRPDNWIVQSQATFVKLIPSTKKSGFGVHFLQLPTYTCQNEVKRAVESGIKIGEKGRPKGNWQLKNVFIFKRFKNLLVWNMSPSTSPFLDFIKSKMPNA